MRHTSSTVGVTRHTSPIAGVTESLKDFSDISWIQRVEFQPPGCNSFKMNT
jgi:hypothetical protein